MNKVHRAGRQWEEGVYNVVIIRPDKCHNGGKHGTIRCNVITFYGSIRTWVMGKGRPRFTVKSIAYMLPRQYTSLTRVVIGSVTPGSSAKWHPWFPDTPWLIAFERRYKDHLVMVPSMTFFFTKFINFIKFWRLVASTLWFWVFACSSCGACFDGKDWEEENQLGFIT